MSDVIASRMRELPVVLDVAARVMPVVRMLAGMRFFRLGVAGAASAVAATAVCLLLPYSPPAGALKSQLPMSPQSTSAPHPAAAGFDVAALWREERAQFFDITGLGSPGARANDWAPAGGMSTLLATRFPSAGHVRMDQAEVAAVPLPPPRAVAVARQTVAPGKPVQIEPKLASLPPSQAQPQRESGTLGFFGKLFADPDQAAKTLLASYPKTAVYDIEKRAVFLPDGEKLEAHSGFGKWMDDPASVEIKDRGVTPPNVYAVSFREKPFHGVRALRLKPVGGGKMYGRDGILAHSYLLGEQGASNGCVSVRDYDKFLQAYEDGKFDRVIVVRNADEPGPALVANTVSGGA